MILLTYEHKLSMVQSDKKIYLPDSVSVLIFFLFVIVGTACPDQAHKKARSFQNVLLMICKILLSGFRLS